MKAKEEQTMTVTERTVETIQTELAQANRQHAQTQRDLDTAHRRRQEIDRELQHLSSELARLDAEQLTGQGDHAAAIEEVQRRQRELKIERAETDERHAHLTAVLANVARIRDNLAAEFAPYEREQIIQQLAQVRAELVAGYRRLAELHNAGLQAQYRLKAIDRLIGPRSTPFYYEGDRYTLAALQFPNAEIAAAHYERGGQAQPSATPAEYDEASAPIAVMG